MINFRIPRMPEWEPSARAPHIPRGSFSGQRGGGGDGVGVAHLGMPL